MKNRSAQSVVIAMVTGLIVAIPGVISAKNGKNVPYEVWGADQSNSVAGAASRGVDGSFIWVWRSEDIKQQITRGILRLRWQ